MRVDGKTLEKAAELAHEINRIYCRALGDESQVPWAEAPDWQKTSARNGVIGVADGNTPEQSHAGWFREKEADGWKWGPAKDPEKKEHPCMVAYENLPPAQQTKDALFVAAVKGILVAHGEEVK